MRNLFRNKFAQKLYSGIHPRWTIPFAYSWSRHSRKTGGSGYNPTTMVDLLRHFSVDYLREHPEINYFVYGHLHVVEDLKLNDSSRMIILGDWISNFSYGIWDGKEFVIRRWNE